MNVESILRVKGADVGTITPDATIADLTRRLADLGVGALVVSRDGSTIEGIISERDVVRALADRGEETLSLCADKLMTRNVFTCQLTDTVAEIMEVMTRERCRHLPVSREGTLVGIISIGDAVKARLEQLEGETTALRDYITSG